MTRQQIKTEEADPYQRRFTFPKWTRTVTVLEEHRLFRRLPEFFGWSCNRHHTTALSYLEQAIAARRVQLATIASYRQAYGEHGSLISGGFYADWPDQAKAAIRAGWANINRMTDQSLAHWQASRRTVSSWRGERDRRETKG